MVFQYTSVICALRCVFNVYICCMRGISYSFSRTIHRSLSVFQHICCVTNNQSFYFVFLFKFMSLYYFITFPCSQTPKSNVRDYIAVLYGSLCWYNIQIGLYIKQICHGCTNAWIFVLRFLFKRICRNVFM